MMNNVINYKYCLVNGYGWSGSSAVVDLLKEFDGFSTPDVEFRLIIDPDGILDLEYKLIDKWNPLRCDIAIKEFLSFAKNLNRVSRRTRAVDIYKKFLKPGLSYDSIFNKKFMKATYAFIEDISDYKYMCSVWWGMDFIKSYSQWLFDRIKFKLKRQHPYEESYFTILNKEEFYGCVRSYIGAIMNAICDDTKYIVLDQAVPVQYPLKAFDYFNNAKVIIVDRDPRDIYVDLINRKALLGADLNLTHDVNKYIKWHKKFREQGKIEHPNVLRVKFEDLILNYDVVVDQIIHFLSESEFEISHSRKMEFLKPEKSRENIGMWKYFSHEDEIRKIEIELAEYI